MKNFLLCALVCTCLSHGLLAGQFRILGLDQIDGLEELYFVQNGEVKSAFVSSRYPTEKFDIPQSLRVSFFATPPKPDLTQRPVLTLDFPNAGTDYLALLRITSASGVEAYTPIYLDDSDRNFPRGSAMICNYTLRTIVAQIDGDLVKLPSGQTDVIQLSKNGKDQFNGGVKFAAEFDGTGKVFSISSWYVSPSTKIFCLIYPDEYGQPLVRRVRLTAGEA
ncbi:MAG: hypothetical protein ACQKBV_07035 [Puniceicoccales bacterium]